MPLFSHILIDGILALSLAALVLAVFVIAWMIRRRAGRDRKRGEAALIDARLGRIFGMLAIKDAGYAAALAALREALWPRMIGVVERTLLDRLNSPADTPVIGRIAEDLGLVQTWRGALQDRDGGGRRGYITRARCADYLGRIRHGESWPLLARALDDPHPDVQGAALRSLAAIREPLSFPILIARLRAETACANPIFSERSLRAALGNFPASSGRALLPLLEDHNPKVRRLAAGILVDMLQNQEAPEPVSFMTAGGDHLNNTLAKLARDEDFEIRARAAVLLGFSPYDGANRRLERLLSDEAWCVRLHAVRAVAAHRAAGAGRLLTARLTDPQWRVREAAARALSEWGADGLDCLIATFNATEDAYTREQIAEVLQASGDMPKLRSTQTTTATGG